MEEDLLMLVNDELTALSSELESCKLNKEGVEVAAVIAGHISKVIFNNSKNEECKTKFTTVKSVSSKFNYSNKLSRGIGDSIHRPNTFLLKIVCQLLYLL